MSIDRFWEKVKKTKTCWIWTGGISSSGYGVHGSPARSVYRIAWELIHGPIPEGTQILHKCDNKTCVRVKHLFMGTHADNMKDKKQKGRQYKPQGELHHRARLSNEDVKKIRLLNKEGYSQRQLAIRFNIDPSAISRIVTYKRWKHI